MRRSQPRGQTAQGGREMNQKKKKEENIQIFWEGEKG